MNEWTVIALRGDCNATAQHFLRIYRRIKKQLLFIIPERPRGQSLHRGWKQGDQPINCVQACVVYDLAAVTHSNYNRILDSDTCYYGQYYHKSTSDPLQSLHPEQTALLMSAHEAQGWGRDVQVWSWVLLQITHMHTDSHTHTNCIFLQMTSILICIILHCAQSPLAKRSGHFTPKVRL